MSNIKIETFIQKFYNESPDENDEFYVSIHSPQAVEEAKKQLEYNNYEDLPGLVSIIIDDEIVFGEYEQTEDLFTTWKGLVIAAITKIEESPKNIILLDNVEDAYLERYGNYAKFIIESDTVAYGYEKKESPLIPLGILIEEIIREAKVLIKFCQDANLPINEDSAYYSIIKKCKLL